MPTTMSLRFPLGRYHATSWDRAVNEGESEWPPSPWRILRALISTWRLRWPGLSEEDFIDIVRPLFGPPCYLTPPSDRGHTRHYMPDLAHTSGAHSTDLVLDPFLWIDREASVLVQWEPDLADGQRAVLAKLCELMPYLGRSESVVRAELLPEGQATDPFWWRPNVHTDRPTRLLAPTPDASLADLEVTTAQVRKLRFSIPPKTRYVPYMSPEETAKTARTPAAATVGAIRWQFMTRAPFRQEFGILATEQLRRTRLYKIGRGDAVLPPNLAGKELPEPGAGQKEAVKDDHAHAHWLWLSDERGNVSELVLWMPRANLESGVAAGMLGWPELRGGADWSPAGFRPGEVHVAALGQTEQVIGELVGPSRNWTCLTPYLPVRHRKRNQSLEAWLSKDIDKECRYRGIEPPSQVIIHDDRAPSVTSYRRYRWSETMKARRAGAWISLVFDSSTAGPLSLGQLSHFGFGLFRPRPTG